MQLRSLPHRSLGLALLLAFALAPLGCRAASGGWSPVPSAALDDAQTAQLERAAEARDALIGELVETLTAELSANGPAAAIAVCRDRAPAIAAETGERLGLRVGRTSWKLRNPDNQAPAWAEALLADRPAEPRTTTGPDGELGVAFPIRVAGACLACHGDPEALEPAVRAALAAEYPRDRATGYREGDLRGWLWVEVPGA